MPPRDNAPAAQDDLVPNGTYSAADGTPAESGASSPAAGSQNGADNAERNRLARQGREAAAQRARAEQAEKRLQDLEARFNNLTTTMNQQQMQDFEQQIAALPPDQRAEIRVQLLQDQVNEMRAEREREAQHAQAMARTEDMKADLVRQANEHYGLTGTAAEIQVADSALDPRNRDTYMASLRALGIARSQRGGPSAARGEEDPMATSKKKPSALDSLTPEQRKAVEQEYEDRQLRETGAGRSFNVRQSGGREEPASEDDFIAASMKASSRRPDLARKAIADLAERGG